MYDWRLHAFEVNVQRIDQQMVGTKRKFAYRLLHRALRSPVDIDLVDGRNVNRGNRPGQRVLANLWGKLLTLLAVQQLGVAQPANSIVRVENHCGGHDGAKERSPTDFVDTGNQLRA